jgi:uncharacterized phiE125 gp8 family phage protein
MRNTITWSSAGPSTEPLELADVQNFLRIDAQTNDNTWLTAAIIAARQACEAYTGLLLIEQTVTQTMDAIGLVQIDLVKGPIMSITSLATTDQFASTTTVTFPNSAYYLDTVGQRIVALNGAVLPTVGQNVGGAVVTYVAGFGSSASDVPQNLVEGMRHYIAASYENRETAFAVPQLVKDLWLPNKKFTI